MQLIKTLLEQQPLMALFLTIAIGYPLAYVIAFRGGRYRNFLIGLIHDNPNAQMILNMQQGILEGLRDTEFAMVVQPVNRSSPTLVDDIRNFIIRQRLYGIVILPPICENDALAALCDEVGCRYVRMGSAELDDPDRKDGDDPAPRVWRQIVAAPVWLPPPGTTARTVLTPYVFATERPRRRCVDVSEAQGSVDWAAARAAGVEAAYARAQRVLDAALPKIANVMTSPAPDVEILTFNERGPVLTVRPYCNPAHYWQVFFDTNRTIRETFGADVQDHYTNMADVELKAFDAAVTDWELARSFERM